MNEGSNPQLYVSLSDFTYNFKFVFSIEEVNIGLRYLDR